MKPLFKITLLSGLFLVGFAISSVANVGFSIPDSVREVTFSYKTTRGLVVLPVTINDTMHVNLILDTGCRNLVLFGKRFQKFFDFQADRTIKFSGLGTGRAVEGNLSLGNKVSINAVLGENIPVVVVPQQNLFAQYTNVHGVIGYDIFIKFEVELNFLHQIITFRPASTAQIGADYQKIPIRLVDSRPIITSTIFFPGQEAQVCDVMIDTGSSLGLLMKTTDITKIPTNTSKSILGRGLNGNIEGAVVYPDRLLVDQFEILSPVAGIIHSQWHNYASVGMEIMRDYSIVLNYCKAYVGIKKHERYN